MSIYYDINNYTKNEFSNIKNKYNIKNHNNYRDYLIYYTVEIQKNNLENIKKENNTKKYNVFETKNPYLYESIYDSYIPYKNEQNFTKMTFINEKRLYSLKEKKYVDLNKN